MQHMLDLIPRKKFYQTEIAHVYPYLDPEHNNSGCQDLLT